mgnify:CR=1 FL=1
MNITSAKYYTKNGETHVIHAVIDDLYVTIPMDLANRHYAEIMRQVEAGELTIAPADEEE